MENFISPIANTQEALHFVELMSEIRRFAPSLQLDTPTIVVFGDQSSGKTSLLKRLCDGLPIPRGTEKCTTSPFEIRMIKDESSQKLITLRIVEDKNHTPLSPNEYDFCDLDGMSTEDIESSLRSAQIAVQNPNKFMQEVNRGDGTINIDGPYELDFTRNAVCVTLRGPNYDFSLSMIDLPGLVRDDESNEKFVIDMVKEYISSDTAILMPIFPATSDIATQSAWKLAKDADSEGNRTVAVLTKVDCIARNKHSDTARLVKGSGSHRLKHGFYLVRNPETGRDGDGKEQADRLEQEDIQRLMQIEDWYGVPDSRFGLYKLGQKLSELQNAAYLANWPRIKKQLEAQQETIFNLLNELPPPPPPGQQPTVRFFELIVQFAELFGKHADVNLTDTSLYQGQLWNICQFDQALLYTRPIFELIYQNQSANRRLFDPVKIGILQPLAWHERTRERINAEEWAKNYEGFEERISQEELRRSIQEAQGGQLISHFAYGSIVKLVENRQKAWKEISIRLLQKNYEWVSFFIDYLVQKEFIEFPRVVPEVQKVLKHLLEEHKAVAKSHLEDFDKMEHMAPNRNLYLTDESKYQKKRSKYFVQLRIVAALPPEATESPNGIVSLINEFQKQWQSTNVSEDTFNDVRTRLITEIRKLMTGESFDEQTRRFVSIIEGAKPNSPMSASTISEINLMKSMFLNRLTPPIPKLQMPDLHNPDVEIMMNTVDEHSIMAASDALAYWKIAHERFREYVPRVIEYYLLHRFSKEIQAALMQDFKLISQDVNMKTRTQTSRLDDVLEEDPEIANKREKYERVRSTLEEVMQRAHNHFSGF